jgi:hypothetical protein
MAKMVLNTLMALLILAGTASCGPLSTNPFAQYVCAYFCPAVQGALTLVHAWMRTVVPEFLPQNVLTSPC